MEPDLKKRYWVFSSPTYYPAGGLDDVVMVTDDLVEATQFTSKDTYRSCFDSDITVRDYVTIPPEDPWLPLDMTGDNKPFGGIAARMETEMHQKIKDIIAGKMFEPLTQEQNIRNRCKLAKCDGEIMYVDNRTLIAYKMDGEHYYNSTGIKMPLEVQSYKVFERWCTGFDL